MEEVAQDSLLIITGCVVFWRIQYIAGPGGPRAGPAELTPGSTGHTICIIYCSGGFDDASRWHIAGHVPPRVTCLQEFLKKDGFPLLALPSLLAPFFDAWARAIATVAQQARRMPGVLQTCFLVVRRGLGDGGARGMWTSKRSAQCGFEFYTQTHARARACTQPFTHSLTSSLPHSLTHSLTYGHVRPCTYGHIFNVCTTSTDMIIIFATPVKRAGRRVRGPRQN